MKANKQLVEIEWLDHWGQSGWRQATTVDCAPVSIRTVGYLLRVGKEGYTTAATKDLEGNVNDVHFCARKLVKRIRTLR